MPSSQSHPTTSLDPSTVTSRPAGVGERAVVVAIDGGAGSHLACLYAAAEARRRDVGVLVLHAVPADVARSQYLAVVLPTQLREAGLEVLRRAESAVRAAAPDVGVNLQLVQGPPVAAIARALGDASLLVLGQEHEGVADALWNHRVSIGLTERVTCPVVTVPSGWDMDTMRNRVVVGVKSEKAALALLGQAFAVADRRRAELVVVHAWALPGPYDDLISSAREVADWRTHVEGDLAKDLAGLQAEYPQVVVSLHLVHEQPSYALVAQASQADLLILERHGHTHLRSLNLGATSRAVLRSAACPVMILAPAALAENDATDSAQLEPSAP